MKFLDKINEQWNLLGEEGDPNTAAPASTDATAPDPTAAPAADEPVRPTDEGYAGLVKILAKSLAMSFPPEALDKIYQTDIDTNNALPIQTAIEAVIKQNEMYGDNPERLQNPNVRSYIESITPSNFIEKYKHLLNAMKKRDPSIKDANI